MLMLLVMKFIFNKIKRQKNATDLWTRSKKTLKAINSEKCMIKIPFTRRRPIWVQTWLSSILRAKANECITSLKTRKSMKTTPWSAKRQICPKAQTPKLLMKTMFGRAKATSHSLVHQAGMIRALATMIFKISKTVMAQSPTTMNPSRLTCLTKLLTTKEPSLALQLRKRGSENTAKSLMVA